MLDFDHDDKLYFGQLAPEIDDLLQQGVAAHFSDPALAERCFLAALAHSPDTLSAHRCLVKHYNRCRQFDKALGAAREWLAAATRGAGLAGDWRQWQAAPGSALAALKGLAFVLLRTGHPGEAAAMIEQVLRLDPEDSVGGSVVAALLPEAVAA